MIVNLSLYLLLILMDDSFFLIILIWKFPVLGKARESLPTFIFSFNVDIY
jgi:hypothetical protein